MDEVREGGRALEGRGGVRVEVAPPTVPSERIATWDATAPRGTVCGGGLAVLADRPERARLERPVGDRVAERLDDSLGAEDQRPDHGQGQQYVEHRPGQVDPEVAERTGAAAGEAPDHRRHDGQPHRRGGEGLHGDAQRLAEVGQGRLAPVELPARVRHEARGGVEGDVPAHAGQVERVDGQEALEPQDGVERREPDRVEGDDRRRIATPALLPGGVHAHQAVDAVLDRRQDA